MAEYQRYSAEKKKDALKMLTSITQDDRKVTKMEFFKFIVLYEKIMTREEADSVLEVFRNLEPKNGVVDFATFEDKMEVHRERSQFFGEGVEKALLGHGKCRESLK